MRGVNSADRYVVDSKGQKIAVIVPVEFYEELMEDMHDLRIVAERGDETPISAAEFTRIRHCRDVYRKL